MNEKLLKILGGDTNFYPYELERKYPRVFANIMMFWDMPEMGNYFVKLMVQEREDRAGFPPEIAAEIMRLSLVYASRHPPDKSDVWEVSADKFANFIPPIPIDRTNEWKPLPADAVKTIEGFGIPCTAKGFHLAIAMGVRRAVAAFLEARVSPEIYNEHGWTPLILAAFSGHDEIITLLIKHRANIQAHDLLGNTALHWAADAGHASSARLLIEHHAAIDACNHSGLTPLAQAAIQRHLEVVLLLVDYGANLDLATRDGTTALHRAAADSYTEIVRTLLHYGADRNIKNSKGDTPLALAAKNNHQAVMKMLMAESKTGNAP